jgi:hypothetical protein
MLRRLRGGSEILCGGEFPATFRDLRRTMTARAQNAQRDAAAMTRDSRARARQSRAAAPMSTAEAERRFFEVQARALGSQASSGRKRAVAAAALWMARARATSGAQ